jgi:hypothetical protein
MFLLLGCKSNHKVEIKKSSCFDEYVTLIKNVNEHTRNILNEKSRKVHKEELNEMVASLIKNKFDSFESLQITFLFNDSSVIYYSTDNYFEPGGFSTPHLFKDNKDSIELVLHTSKFGNLERSAIALSLQNNKKKAVREEVGNITIYFNDIPDCICEWDKSIQKRPIRNSGFFFEGDKRYINECIYSKGVKKLYKFIDEEELNSSKD